MPYSLVYSRSIPNDGRVRITDVAITERSVMIEVLSLVSPFRRIAGYVYAIQSDGLIDYERSNGVTLPFGKNRVEFPVLTLPYYLEFYPAWGTNSGIISVYTGNPSPPLPSVAIPNTEMRAYRLNSGGRVLVSQSLISPFVEVGLPPCSEAFARADGSLWLDQDAPNFKFAFPPNWSANSTDEATFQAVKAESTTVRLPSN